MNLLIHGLLLTISSSLYAALSKIIIVVYYKLKEFNDCLDRRDFVKAKNILDELTDLLGEKNTDVVNAKIAYDFETIVL